MSRCADAGARRDGVPVPVDRRGRAPHRRRARPRQGSAGLADRPLPAARGRVRASGRAARTPFRRQAPRARRPRAHGRRRSLAHRRGVLCRRQRGPLHERHRRRRPQRADDEDGDRPLRRARSVPRHVGADQCLADRHRRLARRRGCARRDRGLALERRIRRGLRAARSGGGGDVLPSAARGDGLRFSLARGDRHRRGRIDATRVVAARDRCAALAALQRGLPDRAVVPAVVPGRERLGHRRRRLARCAQHGHVRGQRAGRRLPPGAQPAAGPALPRDDPRLVRELAVHRCRKRSAALAAAGRPRRRDPGGGAGVGAGRSSCDRRAEAPGWASSTPSTTWVARSCRCWPARCTTHSAARQRCGWQRRLPSSPARRSSDSGARWRHARRSAQSFKRTLPSAPPRSFFACILAMSNSARRRAMSSGVRRSTLQKSSFQSGLVLHRSGD